MKSCVINITLVYQWHVPHFYDLCREEGGASVGWVCRSMKEGRAVRKLLRTSGLLVHTCHYKWQIAIIWSRENTQPWLSEYYCLLSLSFLCETHNFFFCFSVCIFSFVPMSAPRLHISHVRCHEVLIDFVVDILYCVMFFLTRFYHWLFFLEWGK